MPEDEDGDINDLKYGHFCSDKCREGYFKAPYGTDAKIELIEDDD